MRTPVRRRHGERRECGPSCAMNRATHKGPESDRLIAGCYRKKAVYSRAGFSPSADSPPTKLPDLTQTKPFFCDSRNPRNLPITEDARLSTKGTLMAIVDRSLTLRELVVDAIARQLDAFGDLAIFAARTAAWTFRRAPSRGT